MTNNYEWESSVQVLTMCEGCGDYNWCAIGISTNRDLCENCFQ